MSKGRSKLTDDDVRRILCAGEDALDLAVDLDVSESTIHHYRERKSKRAIRIAEALGLPKVRHRRSVFQPTPRAEAELIRAVLAGDA